jgi:hypothetical protein
MVMGLMVDIWWLIFLAWRKGVFAGGFQEKRCIERGFSMVKCGGGVVNRGVLNGAFLVAKDTPCFKYFFGEASYLFLSGCG